MSSVSGTGSASAQVEVMKKSTEVQEQQVAKVLQGLEKQTQEIQQTNTNTQATAHKTGVGTSLDLLS